MKTLSNPFSLIKEALRIYFKEENLWYIVKVFLVAVLLGIIIALIVVLVMVPSGALAFALKGHTVKDVGIFFWFLFIPVIAAAIVISTWIQAAQIKAILQIVKGEVIDVKTTYSLAWKKTGKFLLVHFLSGFLVALGFIFLVIPGLILAIWFSFTSIIVFTQDLGVVDTLKKSKELVKGYFWPVLALSLIHI